MSHAQSPQAVWPTEVPSDARLRLDRLRARRLAEDERLVCLERARILTDTRERYGALSRTRRQAAVIRDLCDLITPVIEPDQLLLGSLPQHVPTEDEEAFIAQHPELFVEAGVPGWLDSMSIYIPDWDWLITVGLDGIREAITARVEGSDDTGREFLLAATEALSAVSDLLRRYASEARRQAGAAHSEARRAELLAAAARCESVAGAAPTSFLDALQLLQITHMVLSCLIGGRDVTPGRLDQYLAPLYDGDLATGHLNRDEAVVLLAHFFLGLSQMVGNATDFDDNLRRSPCQYSHLYVTIGGTDEAGTSEANELSLVVLDAVDLLEYKEPTVVVRWPRQRDDALARRVAELIRRRRPLTIYNDEVVIPALVAQGVPAQWAHGYAHAACHNVLVPGHEAGSGPAGFYNLPRLLLQALHAAGESGTFEQFMDVLRRQVQEALSRARADSQTRWRDTLAPSVPLLQSCLMRESISAARPCWQAAKISHFNHQLMGLATTVDSLLAIRQLVFDERRMSLAQLANALEHNWDGHETLRREIQTRLPRYGQGAEAARALTAALGQMWVEEVERASEGMERVAMWPGFYSHMVHLREGAATGATPDGRLAGQPLSENLSPSRGTPPCAATTLLGDMSVLPFDHTPSGAASLMLSPGDFTGDEGLAKLVALIEGYFRLGGLHVHINVADAQTLIAALDDPDQYADLTVRVAGFSALFTRLNRDVQLDILARAQ